jgi:hypothetical protein
VPFHPFPLPTPLPKVLSPACTVCYEGRGSVGLLLDFALSSFSHMRNVRGQRPDENVRRQSLYKLMTVTKSIKNNSTAPSSCNSRGHKTVSDKMVTGSSNLVYLTMAVVLLTVYLCM